MFSFSSDMTDNIISSLKIVRKLFFPEIWLLVRQLPYTVILLIVFFSIQFSKSEFLNSKDPKFQFSKSQMQLLCHFLSFKFSRNFFEKSFNFFSKCLYFNFNFLIHVKIINLLIINWSTNFKLLWNHEF